jgi:hypothetical protein
MPIRAARRQVDERRRTRTAAVAEVPRWVSVDAKAEEEAVSAIDRVKEMLVGLSDRLDHMLRRRQEKKRDEGESEDEEGSAQGEE